MANIRYAMASSHAEDRSETTFVATELANGCGILVTLSAHDKEPRGLELSLRSARELHWVLDQVLADIDSYEEEPE